jgi:3-(3-hydroxy-phenyl)propionate hydroxylase
MKFMVPRGRLRRLLRNAILRGSLRLPQLRRLVNSGRLSQPSSYAGSPIVVADQRNAPIPAMGSVAPDAPCRSLDQADVTRLRELIGDGFVALLVIGSPREAAAAAIRASRLAWPSPCRIVAIGPDGPLAGVAVLDDSEGEIRRAYGEAGSSAYLVRPDGHLAAWIPLRRADAVDALPGLQAIAIGG